MKFTGKKCAFHIHSCYSFDSLLRPEEIVEYYAANKYEIIIITDHNEIEGARLAREYALNKYRDSIEVVIGEEIRTDIGDIIAFPLTEEIETGSSEDVFIKIKKQNAFTCLPHPYNEHNLFAIHQPDIVDNIDFVETFNSRVLNKKNNMYAEEYCLAYGKKEIIGADAHRKKELGNAGFTWNENYELTAWQGKESTKRNIRLSSLVKAAKTKNFSRIPPLFILYLLGI